jgi:putative polyhydroxyalkanoate system protein
VDTGSSKGSNDGVTALAQSRIPTAKETFMATIDVRHSHALPKEEAKKRAADLAKSMQDRFDLDWRWEGDRIVFDAIRGKAKGTRGSIDVGDTDVRVQIDLPFLLRVLKGTVESKVNEKLAQLL